MKQTVDKLRKWLEQFDDSDEVWAYEGEVIGVVVEHNGKCYVFWNDHIQSDENIQETAK